MTGMQMNRLLVLAAGFALAAQGAASVDARFEAAWNARRGEPYGVYRQTGFMLIVK